MKFAYSTKQSVLRVGVRPFVRLSVFYTFDFRIMTFVLMWIDESWWICSSWRRTEGFDFPVERSQVKVGGRGFLDMLESC